MNQNNLQDALGCISDKHIDEAAAPQKRRYIPVVTALAASLALAVTLGIVLSGQKTPENPPKMMGHLAGNAETASDDLPNREYSDPAAGDFSTPTEPVIPPTATPNITLKDDLLPPDSLPPIADAEMPSKEFTLPGNPPKENTNEETEPDEATPAGKEVLALEDYRSNPVFYDFEEGSLLGTKTVNLSHTVLNEKNESFYNGEQELDILVQYIKETFQVEIDDRWKVFVHYYDTDKTVGMVQFIYAVGEISTNRSILFNISGNKYDTVYYKCLTEDFNEADLIERVSVFKNRYIQGKRKLQEGEAFYEDQTTFTYFIHSGQLVYSYAYFFQYDMGVINNDWGTVRIIDENGNAISVS